MHEAVEMMLSRYACKSHGDYENALKEIIQEIALLGLWRAKFFEKAAFYGGTALRILYKLDRFSEYLDFSLLKPDAGFRLDHYLSAIKIELSAFGFETLIEGKDKIVKTAIQSAFIKAGTKEQFLKIKVPEYIHKKINKLDLIKIKIEIDINPPGGFETEAKLLLQPIPFMVNTYQLPDLFAGKLHAILCRAWKGRVKGRDWYDLVWYVKQNTPVRISHLQKRLEQTGAWPKRKKLTLPRLIELLTTKIEEINFDDAKREVLPFLRDNRNVELWTKKFFREITLKLTAV